MNKEVTQSLKTNQYFEGLMQKTSKRNVKFHLLRVLKLQWNRNRKVWKIQSHREELTLMAPQIKQSNLISSNSNILTPFKLNMQLFCLEQIGEKMHNAIKHLRN